MKIASAVWAVIRFLLIVAILFTAYNLAPESKLTPSDSFAPQNVSELDWAENEGLACWRVASQYWCY